MITSINKIITKSHSILFDINYNNSRFISNRKINIEDGKTNKNIYLVLKKQYQYFRNSIN